VLTAPRTFLYNIFDKQEKFCLKSVPGYLKLQGKHPGVFFNQNSEIFKKFKRNYYYILNRLY